MTDKKLTDVTDNKVGKMSDTEIKKALEICGTYKGKCTDCPAFIKVDRSNCKKVLLGALDIINRLQEENDTLKNVIKNSFLEKAGLDIDPLAEIKAEAYKEFADKFENRILSMLTTATLEEKEIICAYIGINNNILKELVGEDNAN